VELLREKYLRFLQVLVTHQVPSLDWVSKRRAQQTYVQALRSWTSMRNQAL